jgi:predicted small lipoprotein YifL
MRLKSAGCVLLQRRMGCLWFVLAVRQCCRASFPPIRLRDAVSEKGHRALYTTQMKTLQRTIFVALAAFSIALSLALSGCGNKGPLVLADEVPADTPVSAVEPEPSAPPDATTPATPPSAAEDPTVKPPR